MRIGAVVGSAPICHVDDEHIYESTVAVRRRE
jgi:hypothetical protein